MNYRKKYFISFIVFCEFFCVFLYFAGFFKIGLLSDDYLNFYDASNSSITEKLTGNLPFTNPGHFRPAYYFSLQVSSYLHDLFGFSFDNFIFYRVQNLIGFFIVSFTAGWIVLFKTHKVFYALLAGISIVLFSNNIHNICWTAGRVDLLCGMFYLLSLYLSLVYFKEKSISRLAFSLLFFVLALMTKETAVTLPFVLLIFYLSENEIKTLKDNYAAYLPHFVVLALYFIYRLVFLNPGFEKFYDYSVLTVFFKSLPALSVPVDFLSLKMDLLNGDLITFLYLTGLAVFLITCLVICYKKDCYKQFLYFFMLLVILISPYLYIGYIRPQIILIPFAVIVLYLLFSYDWIKKHYENVPFKIPFSLTLILLIFWANFTIITVKDWSKAYGNSLARIEELVKTDIQPNKQTIIIGNAGRLKNSFMFDKLTGAYNYWKFKEFTVKDTINDIVQTAALDEVSLNSKLNYVTILPGEYEISVTGKTQFFYMEGFDNDNSKWSFSNKDMYVEAVENKFLNKPTRIRLKILSKDVNCYLASEMNYFKIY